jgi:hypothetical protein
MARAHVDENVILAFVRNAGQTYSPTAEEILYLADLGISQIVIAALYKQQPSDLPENAATASAETPIPSAPVGETTNVSLFYKALAPYGAWTQAPDYGLCWQPTTATLNSDWRPYVDQGQWLYTDNGWYWQSGYSWGWAAFHYGRWSKNSHLGWVWVPDNVWGPAWVSWRIALSYSGWAPLPPGVGLAASGLTFNHHRIGADSDLGFPPGWFTFVSEGNFLNQNLPNYAISASQAASVFIKSVAVNNYSITDKKVLNLGPGRAAIIAAAATGQVPPRERSSSIAAQSAPAIDPPLFAFIGREDADSTPSLRSVALPALPAPQLPTVRHRRWVEKYSGYPAFAVAHREEPFSGREAFHRDTRGEPVAHAAMTDGVRIMSPSVAAAAKSGR